jgi:speckle-type POZ protein
MPGGGEPSRSASTIVANTASGYHILRIDGYSHTVATPTGNYIASLPFTVGGHRWHIRYYPNGYNSGAKDYISLFLYPHNILAGPVEAQYKFRFVGDVVEQPLTLGRVHSFVEYCGCGYSKFIKREDLVQSKHLRDDSFAIRCDLVVVTNELRVEEALEATAAAARISVPPSDLHQHLGSLLLTEKGADVVFDVAGETFAAHRCVLAARSPVFSAELFGAMKESNAGGGVVHIEDMEPRVFKALLYFVYTDLLPNTKTAKEVEEADVVDDDDDEEGVFSQHLLTREVEEGGIDDDDDEDVLSQHLLVAADKYNLERLKLLCESKLCEYIDVGTVATILALAEQHHCHELKKACFHFLSSPANLRAVVASDGFKHLSRSCPSVMEELVAMLGNLVP